MIVLTIKTFTLVMKIILLRHGRPKVPDLGKLSAYDFYRWIEAYNLATLDCRHKPAQEVVELATACNIIVCSDLRRSLESAKVLGIKEVDYVDALFREFELPCSTNTYWQRGPKLSPRRWAVIYRILWFMGYSSHCESFAAAKHRANKAANILLHKAEHSETVLFVGHSLLNSFIARKLRSKGWQGSISLFNKYWEISVFELSIS